MEKIAWQNMSHPSWVIFFLRWLKFMKWWFQNFNLLLLWLFSKHIWERFILYWLGTSRSSSVCVFKIFSLLIKTWCFQGLTEATWECIQRSVFEEINECFLMASFSGVTGTYFKFAFFGGFGVPSLMIHDQRWMDVPKSLWVSIDFRVTARVMSTTLTIWLIIFTLRWKSCMYIDIYIYTYLWIL